MGTNTLEIKGRQVLGIKTISSNNPYNVDKDHKFHGKTYNLYQYNGTVFTVNSEDEFASWKNSGKLYSVTFTEGSRDVEVDGAMTKVATLQLVGCTNIDQEVSMAQTESTLRRIFKDEEAVAVNEDVMAAITA
jgi:hypothetical protein